MGNYKVIISITFKSMMCALYINFKPQKFYLIHLPNLLRDTLVDLTPQRNDTI